MADASSCAVSCQEDSCIELLPAAADDEATQLHLPAATPLQQHTWRSPAILVLVLAAVAALVGAAVVVETRHKHLPHPTAAATSDSLAFYSETYEDPQGQTVCPAAMTGKGSCKCGCAWAREIGACEQRRDDGTCCYSCCCPNAGAFPPGQDEGGYLNKHEDAYYPGEDGAYHANTGPSAHTTIHVHHHYDHYHARHEDRLEVYHVGEHVYVKASDGRSWAAEVVDANMDGTYRVRYLADRYGGRSVLVSANHLYRQHELFGPQLWWLIFGCILVVLCGLACYLFFRSAPR